MPDPTPAPNLRAIGWPDTPALREAAGGARVARVIGQHRSAYVVADGPEHEWRAQPPAPWTRPRFDPELRAAVGDWVTLEPDGKHIATVLPRYALLKRAAAGEHYKAQPIAANIDHVLVVVGLDRDFNPRRIERYLLLVQASGAAPVLVLTKADQCDIAKDAASIAVLHPYLGLGRTVVLVGSSGAGKSTLTNTLLGTERMKTNTVRENDQRGRHTTTFRALIPLPQGGCLIDTPGMRELKLSGEELLEEGAFADIDAIIGACRFSDCGHSNEPGCAILAAREDGSLDEARYAHYLKLRDERDAAATSLAARRAEVKELHRGFHKRLKDKYGRR